MVPMCLGDRGIPGILGVPPITEDSWDSLIPSGFCASCSPGILGIKWGLGFQGF